MKVWCRKLDGQYFMADYIFTDAEAFGGPAYVYATLVGDDEGRKIAGPFLTRPEAQDWLDDYFRREMQGKDIMLIKGSPR